MEVYKFVSHRILVIDPILSTYFLNRQFLSGKFMHVVIMPLLKCWTKDPTDNDNYCPIDIFTFFFLKSYRAELFDRVEEYLNYS